MSAAQTFLRCVRCSVWRHRSKMESGLCPECRRKLDGLADHIAEQAAAENQRRHGLSYIVGEQAKKPAE